MKPNYSTNTTGFLRINLASKEACLNALQDRMYEEPFNGRAVYEFKELQADIVNIRAELIRRDRDE